MVSDPYVVGRGSQDGRGGEEEEEAGAYCGTLNCEILSDGRGGRRQGWRNSSGLDAVRQQGLLRGIGEM